MNMDSKSLQLLQREGVKLETRSVEVYITYTESPVQFSVDFTAIQTPT